MSLKIAIAQINATVGDLAGNAARILDFAQRAQAEGADLVLTPELALCGYPPEDLLFRADFYEACERELDALAAATHWNFAPRRAPGRTRWQLLQRCYAGQQRQSRGDVLQAASAELRGV
jgi:hypothetical protein